MPIIMQSDIVAIGGTDREIAKSRPNPAATTAMAYLIDGNSQVVARRSFADLGLSDADVARGSIDTAIEELPLRSLPRLLLVDIGGIGDPLPQINRLAEICAPDTEVVAVGDRNDIALYRDLRAAGVAEYFYKPLIGNVLDRMLIEIIGGARRQRPSRGGKLVFVLGVRGGVGATTIATSLAWYFAEMRQRRVLLLDLDLHTSDAALQLDVQPNHALREAIRDPERVDEMFLGRGVVPVSNCLGLLAALPQLDDPLTPSDGAIRQLLDPLLAHFRYVLADLPGDLAGRHPGLLQIPSTVLLVSDASAGSIRAVARWREFLGPNTPERTVIHVLNKKDADGSVARRKMLRAIPPPDIAIKWDRRIMSATALGTRAVQACAAIQRGIAALSLQIGGVAAGEGRSLWSRIFG